MQKILSLLDKFRKVRPPDEAVRVNFSQIVGEKLGIVIPLENIKVRSFSIYLDGLSAVEKSQIFIYKKILLDELEGKIGKILVNNIR